MTAGSAPVPTDPAAPTSYPEVHDPVYAILRRAGMPAEHNVVVWRCVEAAFAGARGAGLMADRTPPAGIPLPDPDARRVRRAWVVARRRRRTP